MKHLILMLLYLSIYQATSTTSVIECTYDVGSPDRLVVENKDLESKQVESWVMKTCKPKEGSDDTIRMLLREI